MINLLAAHVATALAAQRYPVHVSYGPTFSTPENYPHGLIQIQRDPAATDAVEAPQGSRHNPTYAGVRLVAARATIYTASSEPGATVEEHEELCEAYIDAFLIAVAEWCAANNRGSNPFRLGRMSYLTAEERNREQVWPGVAYRLQFTINRAVMKVAYDGLIRPTVSMSGARRIIANRTEVRYAATDPETNPPATNCGG